MWLKKFVKCGKYSLAKIGNLFTIVMSSLMSASSILSNLWRNFVTKSDSEIKYSVLSVSKVLGYHDSKNIYLQYSISPGDVVSLLWIKLLVSNNFNEKQELK